MPRTIIMEIKVVPDAYTCTIWRARNTFTSDLFNSPNPKDYNSEHTGMHDTSNCVACW